MQQVLARRGANPLDRRHGASAPVVVPTVVAAGPNPLDERRNAPRLVGDVVDAAVVAVGPNPLDERRSAPRPVTGVIEVAVARAGPNPFQQRRDSGPSDPHPPPTVPGAGPADRPRQALLFWLPDPMTTGAPPHPLDTRWARGVALPAPEDAEHEVRAAGRQDPEGR